MSRRPPSYRLHRASGQAVVTLNRRDIYLGKHGTPESRAKYDQVIAEWLSNGRCVPPASAVVSVAEVLVAFLTWAEGYYRKNGEPTREVELLKYAIRPARELYGMIPAQDFGPLQLKTVRQAYIASGICRNEVNRRTGQIVRAFKWAVAEGLVDPMVHHALTTVPWIRRGRGVRESDPVGPVDESHILEIQRHVSHTVWTMTELQLLTGMRPGEVCMMRPMDIDTTGKVWIYTPVSHKTEHHGKCRQILIGPKSRDMLIPWLAIAERTQYLFITKVQTYRVAIRRACERAGIPVWHPSQLRHNAATRLRREYGLDVAQAVLGHSSADTTQVYADVDRAKAEEAMLKSG